MSVFDWQPIQCAFGPHWHEQPNADKAQQDCKKSFFQSMGGVIAKLNVESIIQNLEKDSGREG